METTVLSEVICSYDRGSGHFSYPAFCRGGYLLDKGRPGSFDDDVPALLLAACDWGGIRASGWIGAKSAQRRLSQSCRIAADRSRFWRLEAVCRPPPARFKNAGFAREPLRAGDRRAYEARCRARLQRT